MRTFAFIDESGTDGMNLASGGNSALYVIAAVVIPEDLLVTTQAGFAQTRAQYFQGGSEMCSASLGKNDQRRRAVLVALSRFAFQMCLLVVDKRNLRSVGFQYPASFVKNLHDRMYSQLLGEYREVNILADKVKRPAFMAELRRYLENKQESTLFQPWQMKFVDSTLEVGIQAADVIAGTIARCFESPSGANQLDDYLKILEKHIVCFQNFPDYSARAVVDAESLSSDYDAPIESRSVRDAIDFVNDSAASGDVDLQAQAHCAQELLGAYYQNPYSWVPARALCQSHMHQFDEEISSRKLRLTIIGKLRDRGLLIASHRGGGYKLAVTAGDMTEFINTINEKVKKMVARVEVARTRVLTATNQRCDVLAHEEFANLRKAIEGMRSLPSSANQEGEKN